MPARMVGMTSPGAVLSNDSQPPALPLRPKPEGLLEPLGIGRPHLRIDDAGRALAVERHDQLLGGDAAHIGASSRVMPAVWGLAITLSSCSSGWSTAGGSLSHTSRPAPAICFARSASASARSSWMKPRAVVMK